MLSCPRRQGAALEGGEGVALEVLDERVVRELPWKGVEGLALELLRVVRDLPPSCGLRLKVLVVAREGDAVFTDCWDSKLDRASQKALAAHTLPLPWHVQRNT